MPIGDTFVALPVIARAPYLTRGYLAPMMICRRFSHVRDYAAVVQYGGGGTVQRPLVGLLHPPGRRGNRAAS